MPSETPKSDNVDTVSIEQYQSLQRTLAKRDEELKSLRHTVSDNAALTERVAAMDKKFESIFGAVEIDDETKKTVEAAKTEYDSTVRALEEEVSIINTVNEMLADAGLSWGDDELAKARKAWDAGDDARAMMEVRRAVQAVEATKTDSKVNDRAKVLAEQMLKEKGLSAVNTDSPSGQPPEKPKVTRAYLQSLLKQGVAGIKKFKELQASGAVEEAIRDGTLTEEE